MQKTSDWFWIIYTKCILFFSKPKRLPLREWAKLDDARQKIQTAAESNAWYDIPPLIYRSIRLSVTYLPGLSKTNWIKIAELYVRVVGVNQPTIKFPVLTSKTNAEKQPWEYEGRIWYFWLNLFATKYGWGEKEIGFLDIDEAIGLYQEILIDEQLRQEWEHGLSDLAYEYVPSTKKSKYRPLKRPDWMIGFAPKSKKPVKKIRMRATMLPVGNVVNLGADE